MNLNPTPETPRFVNGHLVIVEILKSPNFNGNKVPEVIRNKVRTIAETLKTREPFGLTDNETKTLLLAVVFGINPAYLNPEQVIAITAMMHTLGITPDVIRSYRQGNPQNN